MSLDTTAANVSKARRSSQGPMPIEEEELGGDHDNLHTELTWEMAKREKWLNAAEIESPAS